MFIYECEWCVRQGYGNTRQSRRDERIKGKVLRQGKVKDVKGIKEVRKENV